MRFLAAALVTIVVVVCDFLSDMERFGISRYDGENWAEASTVCLLLFICLIAFDSRRSR